MNILPKTVSGKVILSIVIAAITVGVVLMSGVNEGTDGSGIMVKLFLLFMGVIIAIQVIPGMLLFGAMIKGLGSLSRKETANKVEK